MDEASTETPTPTNKAAAHAARAAAPAPADKPQQPQRQPQPARPAGAALTAHSPAAGAQPSLPEQAQNITPSAPATAAAAGAAPAAPAQPHSAVDASAPPSATAQQAHEPREAQALADQIVGPSPGTPADQGKPLSAPAATTPSASPAHLAKSGDAPHPSQSMGLASAAAGPLPGTAPGAATVDSSNVAAPGVPMLATKVENPAFAAQTALSADVPQEVGLPDTADLQAKDPVVKIAPKNFPTYAGPDGVTESSSGRWSKEEDDALRAAVERIGAKNWKRIASEYLGDRRTDVQCLHRWQKVLRPGLVKGPWTAVEDTTIRQCMELGITRWSEIAKRVPGRIGKQCRERWFNHLDPTIKRGEWTLEEDQQLIIGQANLGNRWSQIAKLYLPGRPENAVKNRWNAATRRRRTGDGLPAMVGASALVAAATAAKSSSPTAASAAMAAASAGSANGSAAKRRRTGPQSRKAGPGGNFAEGLEGMVSLAGICAAAEPAHTKNGAKKPKLTKEERAEIKARERAAKKAEREAKKEAKAKAREAAREAKKAEKAAAKAKKKADKKTGKKRDFASSDEDVNKAASFGAAALLAAAGELQDGPAAKRSRRGFSEARPNLSAPTSISTKVTRTSNSMATPSFAPGQQQQQSSSISPSKSGGAGQESAAMALHFLSNVASKSMNSTKDAAAASESAAPAAAAEANAASESSN